MSKEEIPGGKRSVRAYILTYFRLYRDNRLALCSQQMGTLISASAAPHCGGRVLEEDERSSRNEEKKKLSPHKRCHKQFPLHQQAQVQGRAGCIMIGSVSRTAA